MPALPESYGDGCSQPAEERRALPEAAARDPNGSWRNDATRELAAAWPFGSRAPRSHGIELVGPSLHVDGEGAQGAPGLVTNLGDDDSVNVPDGVTDLIADGVHEVFEGMTEVLRGRSVGVHCSDTSRSSVLIQILVRQSATRWFPAKGALSSTFFWVPGVILDFKGNFHPPGWGRATFLFIFASNP